MVKQTTEKVVVKHLPVNTVARSKTKRIQLTDECAINAEIFYLNYTNLYMRKNLKSKIDPCILSFTNELHNSEGSFKFKFHTCGSTLKLLEQLNGHPDFRKLNSLSFNNSKSRLIARFGVSAKRKGWAINPNKLVQPNFVARYSNNLKQKMFGHPIFSNVLPTLWGYASHEFNQDKTELVIVYANKSDPNLELEDSKERFFRVTMFKQRNSSGKEGMGAQVISYHDLVVLHNLEKKLNQPEDLSCGFNVTPVSKPDNYDRPYYLKQLVAKYIFDHPNGEVLPPKTIEQAVDVVNEDVKKVQTELKLGVASYKPEEPMTQEEYTETAAKEMDNKHVDKGDPDYGDKVMDLIVGETHHKALKSATGVPTYNAIQGVCTKVYSLSKQNQLLFNVVRKQSEMLSIITEELKRHQTITTYQSKLDTNTIAPNQLDVAAHNLGIDAKKILSDESALSKLDESLEALEKTLTDEVYRQQERNKSVVNQKSNSNLGKITGQ
jgi:hypothetical protein